MDPTGQGRHDPTPPAAPRDAAERVTSEHLRAALARQRAELDALRRRPTVRALLAADRRLQPARQAWARAARRIRRAGDRAALRAAALPRHAAARRDPARGERAPARLAPTPADPDVIRIPAGRSTAAVVEAIDTGEADLICLLPEHAELGDGALARLAAAIDEQVRVAVPLRVHPTRSWSRATPHDGRVRAAGFDAARTGPYRVEIVAVAAGRRVEDVERRVEDVERRVDVLAGGAAGLVVDRAAYVKVGGLRTDLELDVAAIDLCLRIRGAGWGVALVPGVRVVDGAPVTSLRSLTRPVDRAGTDALVEHHGPALLRRAAPLPRGAARITIATGVPGPKVASRWGDWHLARALGDALRRCGHEVRVLTASDSRRVDTRVADLQVVIRGLQPAPRRAGRPQVTWLISHPERLDERECEEVDLVLVASERFAAHLREQVATPVEVMLQATDHRRFVRHPRDPRFHHDVAIVARTRDVMRPVVADALAAGLRPVIYGAGWSGFVDPALVVADYVPNEQLPALYSSIGVLLNDHWDTMRAWGFVSNRIFDALACGTPVVSDHLPEIPRLFGAAVATYANPNELREAVERILRDPGAARVRAEAGMRSVVAAHTFDHRARQLLTSCVDHGLLDPETRLAAEPS